MLFHSYYVYLPHYDQNRLAMIGLVFTRSIMHADDERKDEQNLQ